MTRTIFLMVVGFANEALAGRPLHRFAVPSAGEE